jgi:hypothetical protein
MSFTRISNLDGDMDRGSRFRLRNEVDNVHSATPLNTTRFLLSL